MISLLAYWWWLLWELKPNEPEAVKLFFAFCSTLEITAEIVVLAAWINDKPWKR